MKTREVEWLLEGVSIYKYECVSRMEFFGVDTICNLLREAKEASFGSKKGIIQEDFVLSNDETVGSVKELAFMFIDILSKRELDK